MTDTIAHVPVGRISPNPDNPRKTLTGIDELAESIGSVGVLQPLTITPHDDGFMVVAGHRRLAAATKAGLEVVPCIVRDDLSTADPEQLLVFGLVENIARADMDPFDEAEAYAALVARGWTHAEIARQVGVSGFTVSHRLRLLKLTASERRLVREGVLGLQEAVALTKPAATPRPRPARVESNIARRLDRTVILLRDTADWLASLTGHDRFDLVDKAASHVNAAVNLLTETTPGNDPDAPRGEMRGRLACNRCGQPIADHKKVGQCPVVVPA